MLPQVHILAEPDRWIRERLLEMAAIPYEARRLAAELRKSPIDVKAPLRDDVARRLKNMGFHQEDIVFEERQELDYLWTKASIMMRQLESWKSDRRFGGFIAKFAPAFDELKARYQDLTPNVLSCLHILREMPPQSLVGNAGAVVRLKNSLTEQSADFLDGVYIFISQGLLHCGMTLRARAGELAALGFDLREMRLKTRFSMNHLMSLFFAVGFVVLLGAGGLLFSAWIILQWLGQLAPGSRCVDDHAVPSVPRTLVLSAAIGFLIGYLIPTWYREAREAPREDGLILDAKLAERIQARTAGAALLPARPASSG